MLFRRPITSEALGGGLCSHANHLTRQCKGKYIVVGGPDGRWISPLVRGINAVVLSRLVSQVHGRASGEIEQRGPDHHARSHGGGKGNTGHRQALQVE